MKSAIRCTSSRVHFALQETLPCLSRMFTRETCIPLLLAIAASTEFLLMRLPTMMNRPRPPSRVPNRASLTQFVRRFTRLSFSHSSSSSRSSITM